MKRLILSVLIAVTSLAFASLGQAADTPNIIVLLADDLGYGELSIQGNPEIPTPHIDSIASNGVRFTNGYVTGPNCSPSRAGFMSGRIPTRFGYENNPIGERNEDPTIGFPSREVTIAETLQDAGYVTGIIGKWHLGGTAAYHPFRNGFEEFYGFMHEGHYFVPPPWKGVSTMLRRATLPRGGTEGRWVGKKGLSYHKWPRNEPDYDANNPIIRGGAAGGGIGVSDRCAHAGSRRFHRSSRRQALLSLSAIQCGAQSAAGGRCLYEEILSHRRPSAAYLRGHASQYGR